MISRELRSFIARARAYQVYHDFEAREIDTKLLMASEFRLAKEAYAHEPGEAFRILTRAFQTQNLVHWRAYSPLLESWSRRKKQARSALLALWNDSSALEPRFRQFANSLETVGIRQTGAQLSITSVLLMALSPRKYPHVITSDFSKAFEMAGFPPLGRAQDAAERYSHALRFFDMLCALPPSSGLVVRHRLEARALTWCIGREVDPAEYAADPASEESLESAKDPETLRMIKMGSKGRVLTETEKRSLVLSRRGQGRFRDELLEHWGSCSVTGCRNSRLLRASHIKPWKLCTNRERLDSDNGLLLSPALDAALDCGLITFSDRGEIVISPLLSGSDRKHLGIREGMKLCRLGSGHRKYLRFHRANVYRK